MSIKNFRQIYHSMVDPRFSLVMVKAFYSFSFYYRHKTMHPIKFGIAKGIF